MTIFDSIKYPVNNDITYDELRNIPEPIIERWISEINPIHQCPRISNTSFSSDCIAVYPDYVEEALALLRKQKIPAYLP